MQAPPIVETFLSPSAPQGWALGSGWSIITLAALNGFTNQRYASFGTASGAVAAADFGNFDASKTSLITAFFDIANVFRIDVKLDVSLGLVNAAATFRVMLELDDGTNATLRSFVGPQPQTTLALAETYSLVGAWF